MSLIDTSEQSIIQAKQSVRHNKDEFESFMREAQREIEGTRDRANATLDSLQARLNSAQTKLRTLQGKLNQVNTRLSAARRELAACRPPRKVTVTYTDSDGNTHTETYIEDPDGPKRERLQAEIYELEQKRDVLERSIREFQAYILQLEKGINAVKGAYPHIENANRELETCEPQVRDNFESMDDALDDVEEAVESYNSVNISGSSEIGMEPLPYFEYDGGMLFTSILGTPSGGTTAPSRPTAVTIIFDKIVNNEDEFRKEIKKIIDENHCKITLKIHKLFSNFKYSVNLNQIRSTLTIFKFVQQKNPIGTYLVTVDGYYVFERSAS